jgi:hypothetical protein
MQEDSGHRRPRSGGRWSDVITDGVRLVDFNLSFYVFRRASNRIVARAGASARPPTISADITGSPVR